MGGLSNREPRTGLHAAGISALEDHHTWEAMVIVIIDQSMMFKFGTVNRWGDVIFRTTLVGSFRRNDRWWIGVRGCSIGIGLQGWLTSGRFIETTLPAVNGE